MILGEELLKHRNNILDEMKNIVRNEKIIEDECVRNLDMTKRELLLFKDGVNKEINFLKSEVSKIKNDTGEFYSAFKEKTDNLEQYLDESQNEMNRRFESVAPSKRRLRVIEGESL